MSDAAIQVHQMSKRYRIGQRQPYLALRDVLSDAAAWPYRKIQALLAGKGPSEEAGSASVDGWIWALKDVSFEVGHGEVLGIIGANGAGKSTLLKLLARITRPTHGFAEVYGRVGSLLEVGTGFHPELTGRENIYLNGAVLGMRKVEIERKFDEIVDFAEIEKFIDTPVKRYSSGMYMRLAFSVAAHLEPEILFVDEVLAVGDAAFQKKCLGKMSGVARQGRTVLFVSHNLMAMQGLCSRILWLQQGEVVDEGEPGQVISRYLQGTISAQREHRWDVLTEAPGNEVVRLRRVCARPVGGSPADPIDVHTSFLVELEYAVLQSSAVINLDIQLYNEQGILVFAAGPGEGQDWYGQPLPAGVYRDVCTIPADLLNDGMHRVGIHIVKDLGTLIYGDDDMLTIDVQDNLEGRAGWLGKWPGAIRPALDWRTERIDALPVRVF